MSEQPAGRRGQGALKSPPQAMLSLAGWIALSAARVAKLDKLTK